MRFFDTHCDTVMHARDDDAFGFLTGDARAHIDLPRLLAAGHRVQLFAVFASQRYFADRDVRAMGEQAIATIHDWAAASEGRMQVARTAADLARAVRGPDDGAHLAALIGLEGADPLGDRADNLAHFFDLGVRLVILAWDDNAFSGTTFGSGGGLSSEGAKLVEHAEALGVMVDVSHLSDTAFDQVAGMTRKSFIASHSNCRSVCPSGRNLTDAQIRTLADQGGVMGINLAPDFLDPGYLAATEQLLAPAKGLDWAARQKFHDEVAGPQLTALPRPGVEWIVRHVQHAIRIGGEGCVGLGGDLDGISFTPAGIEGVQSYPLIADALAAAGLTERQVEQVCWRNMARVFGEVLPG